MKKGLLFALFAALCVPAFAQGPRDCKGDDCPQPKARKAAVMQGKHEKGKKDARTEEFRKARRAHKAQMRATEEKMEKLVDEYNKLTSDKKKKAKKEEISEMVASIRDEQIKFKEEQLAKFKERLDQMEKNLDEEKSSKAKKAWVEEKTEAVIAEEGDLDVLFGPKPGPRMGPSAKDGPRMGPGPKDGPRMGPGPKEGPEGKRDVPPAPPAEPAK